MPKKISKKKYAKLSEVKPNKIIKNNYCMYFLKSETGRFDKIGRKVFNQLDRNKTRIL